MKTAAEILSQYDQVPDYLGIGYSESDVLQAMYEFAEQLYPKWISVEDQSPSLQQWILCFNKASNGVTMNYYSLVHQSFTIANWQQINITHWMNLPEPPSVKKQIHANEIGCPFDEQLPLDKPVFISLDRVVEVIGATLNYTYPKLAEMLIIQLKNI